LMTPVLVDRVIAHAGAARRGSATLRRVRLRSIDAGAGDVGAAEVFASFTRSGRVHAVAARIERYRDRWRMVALQIG
ncbi:MAG: Rv3235 family protein, partial [Mycobacterium sp.]